jgi:hypothetical protein
MVEDSLLPSDLCWCGHQVKFHHMQVCKWCARMERRYPRFDFMPRHKIATSVPRRYMVAAMNKLEESLTQEGRES